MTAVHSTGQKGGIYNGGGKNLVPGSAQMLLLRLLAERDMYGYQMIEELAQRSNDTFALKAGTLYPILHALEADGSIESYEQPGGAATAGKPRRYYRITRAGRGALEAQQTEWRRVSRAINAVLETMDARAGWCCNGTDAKGMAADRHSPAALPPCGAGCGAGAGESSQRTV